jgi:hypothetical protein
MDGDSETASNGQRLYDVVREGRTSDGHPYYTPKATEDEYMQMIHPKTRDNYVIMRPANSSSPQKSSTIPVPMPQGDSIDEYNTLQHFQGRMSGPRNVNSLNYETLPTIEERVKPEGRSRDNYVNHPLPQDVKGLVPRMYQPSYENHEFRGRRGSHDRESYENTLVNSNGNNNHFSKQRVQ